MQINGVKHKELSTIDDEFARDVSDCATLEEFKAQIKNNMEEVGHHNARRIFNERVVTRVVAEAEVEPPAVLVDEQLQEETQRIYPHSGHAEDGYEHLPAPGTRRNRKP